MWLELGDYGGAGGGGTDTRGLVGRTATTGHRGDQTVITAPATTRASTASTLVQVLRGRVGQLASSDDPLSGNTPGAPGGPHLSATLQGSAPASRTEGGEAAPRPGVFKVEI